MVYYPEVAEPFPDMSDKVIIVTGSSSGVGLDAARIFVKQGGAHVILACRNLEKARPFEEELNAAGPGRATLLCVDTSDVTSVRAFVESFNALDLGRLDVLLLNAGIMFGDREGVKTASEEFPQADVQFATNHLGHFLMANLLLPYLTSTPGARVLSVSSPAARFSKALDYDVLTLKEGTRYDAMAVYCFTKLANLLFTRELQRRLKASGADTLAIPCHPGYARTNLAHRSSGPMAGFAKILSPMFSHSSVSGCHPLVMAAIHPNPDVDCYCTPSRMKEFNGEAWDGGVFIALANSEAGATELWEKSEELVGMKSSI